MSAMKSAIRAICVLSVLLSAAVVSAQELPAGPISLGGGRVTIGADISASTSTHDDELAWFNYTDYSHNTLRLARIAISTDVKATGYLSFLAEVRSENGDGVQPYAMFARITPWKDRRIDIQAGRIPPTFGSFSRRVYGSGNPLIGYPLAYQYLTSLRPDAIPSSTAELLVMRARGWRPSYALGDHSISTGMPLISGFRWDTGVQVHAGNDQISVAGAVTNGTISDPRARDNNHGKQVSARAQWQPVMGLLIGGSAARGPYLSDVVRDLLPRTDSSMERAFGFDAEYSRDHWLVRTEGVLDQWDVPTLSTALTARSAFVEGTYKVRPGFFVAARVDKLDFSRVRSGAQLREWDAPVSRIETGLGFYIQRNLLGRVTYQHNWRDGGLIRNRKQLALQIQFWL